MHVLDIVGIQESAHFQPEILSIQFELTQPESHQRFLKSCQPLSLARLQNYLPIDQMVLGRLRVDDKVMEEVLPAVTVTLPDPASSSPWNRVTVYVPGFIMFLVNCPL